MHAQEAQTAFVIKLIRFRKEHPVFRRPKFFQGRPIRGLGIKDIMWLNPAGKEMSDDEWTTGYARSIGLLLSGQTMDVRDSMGEPITDDTFVLFFNAHHQNFRFAFREYGTAAPHGSSSLTPRGSRDFWKKRFIVRQPERWSSLSARWLF